MIVLWIILVAMLLLFVIGGTGRPMPPFSDEEEKDPSEEG